MQGGCGFVVGIVVNGGGRQGTAGDCGALEGLRGTAGDGRGRPVTVGNRSPYEATPEMADDGRG